MYVICICGSKIRSYTIEKLIERFLSTLLNHLIDLYIFQAAGLELKENLGAGAAAAWTYPSVYHPYDAAFGYPFNG